MAKGKRTNNDLLNITQKTKDRATRTPLKTGGDCRFFARVCSFCSTCGTRHVTIPVTIDEWGMELIVLTTSGIYPWSFVPQIIRNS